MSMDGLPLSAALEPADAGFGLDRSQAALSIHPPAGQGAQFRLNLDEFPILLQSLDERMRIFSDGAMLGIEKSSQKQSEQPEPGYSNATGQGKKKKDPDRDAKEHMKGRKLQREPGAGKHRDTGGQKRASGKCRKIQPTRDSL